MGKKREHRIKKGMTATLVVKIGITKSMKKVL